MATESVDKLFNTDTMTGSLTPDQYAAYKNAEFSSEYPAFKPDYPSYNQQATSEIAPYYEGLYSSLSGLEQSDIERTNQTYDDILKNMQESFNQRGTFFGGESVKAEQNLGAEQARTISDIQSRYAGLRASAGLEQTRAITDRGIQLADRAYQDYWTNRQAEIDSKVYGALKDYLPDYADKIKQQLSDKNSLWLDIPIDGDLAAGSSDTQKTDYVQGTGYEKVPVNKQAEDFMVGEYGRFFGNQPKTDTDWNFVKYATYGYKGKRDLQKEQAALELFIKKYNSLPKTTEDWNVVAALAYSGVME